jgi:hypothetical protein
MSNRALLAAAFFLALSVPCLADTVKFHGTMTAGAEVPPTKSTGRGEANATLDTTTHQLTYDVTFKGFASDVTMAHFHGPAEPGKNAGVVVPLGVKPTSPIHGTATLTPAQQDQLIAGQWYANVHTTNNPGGAIRGQMLQVH